jgi:hypothetical protein
MMMRRSEKLDTKEKNPGPKKAGNIGTGINGDPNNKKPKKGNLSDSSNPVLVRVIGR